MSRSTPQRHPVEAVDSAHGNGHGNGKKRKPWRRRRDWGGVVARVLCALFAIVGLVPLALGGLVRLDEVQQWAAYKTSVLLNEQLGLDARYELVLRPWPLQLAMENVEIAANDGGEPVLRARSVIARPRIFSLLAGKIDFGEVEIEEPELRVVLRDGKLVNLSYRLPESEGTSTQQELPLSAVALTNARLDLTVDDVKVRSRAIDVDLTLDRGPVELSLRAGDSEVDIRRRDPARDGVVAFDEDRLCRLELRARIAPDQVLVRRLELDGAVDLDPAADTRPGCDLPEDDWRHVRVEVAASEAQLSDAGALERLDGRLRVRLPVPLVHRFVDLPPTSGWIDLDLEQASYDKTHQLPEVSGRLQADDLGIDSKMIARDFEATVSTKNDAIRVSDIALKWAGGSWTIASVVIKPFEKGMPLAAENILVKGVTMPDLLDDINVHPNAHVGWNIDRTEVKHFGGTLQPMALSGPMTNTTRNFAVYDSPVSSANKQLMMGVERGDLSGTFKVTDDAIVLSNFTLIAPHSKLRTTVSIHFDEHFGLNVYEGSVVDLRDVSPLVDIDMKGLAKVDVTGHGTFDEPAIEGDLSIDDFEFAGFGIGDVVETKAKFVPLQLELSDAKLVSGQSHYDVPHMKIDFDDGDAAVVLSARADTRKSGLRMGDFFAVLDLQNDPRWRDMQGTGFGTADIDYVLGGRRDRCRSGNLRVRGNMDFKGLSLWGEPFDSGAIELDYRWDDINAGDKGLEVDIQSALLRKGSGSLLASGNIRHGAKLQADVTGTAIPLDRIRSFQDIFGGPQKDDDPQRKVRPEADVSFIARLGGSLDRLEARAEIDVSRTRIGPDVLPTSQLTLEIIPTAPPRPTAGRTRCGNELVAATAPNASEPDAIQGIYRLAGNLFEGQIRFEDLEITQQQHAMLSGQLDLSQLDLGAFANLMPDVAFSAQPPRGHISADVFIDELPLDEPGLAEVRMFVRKAEVSRADTRLEVGNVREPVYLSGDALRVPNMPVTVTLASGLRGTLLTGGSISHLSRGDPQLDLSMRMDPVDLSKIGVDIPSIERAAGDVSAALTVMGTLSQPQLGGRVALEGGLLRLEGVPVTLEDIEVDIRIDEDEVQIRRAKARAGNTGNLSLNGRFPLRGLELRGGAVTLVARDVKIPIADGVKVTANAMLNASFKAPTGAKRELPNITGTVSLTQFSYTRPMTFSVDIDSLTGRRRTEVDTYRPEDDIFNFDIKLVSPRPLRISNNLVDMRLDVTPPGIQVSGTNQRFGARGALRIEKGGKLFLQGHDFAVRDGTVTFDNPKRIAPKLDVHATTEYRRYAAASDSDTAAAGDAAGGGSMGGKWRIAMHAYGDTDEPKVRFTSDPPLSQDDIVLLLQVGMTRAELDRGLAGSLAQTVGIEAISAVTGLNQAVQKTLPLFDEVHVGSQYSSRSGRPEPTVSVGKRITEDVRANVTTGLSETREVRSNIEWKLSRGVSVTGSYDNVNDVSSSALGNIGADLRWHLEFE